MRHDVHLKLGVQARSMAHRAILRVNNALDYVLSIGVVSFSEG